MQHKGTQASKYTQGRSCGRKEIKIQFDEVNYTQKGFSCLKENLFQFPVDMDNA